MTEHSIELFGQKFSYPTTWQGTIAVAVICTCIAFLGYTLDEDQIASYSHLFGGKSEAAYNESLETISKLNSQIEDMQATITRLTSTAGLAANEEKAVYKELEDKRAEREKALASLNTLQQERQDELVKASPGLTDQAISQKRTYLADQQAQILKQLDSVQKAQVKQLIRR